MSEYWDGYKDGFEAAKKAAADRAKGNWDPMSNTLSPEYKLRHKIANELSDLTPEAAGKVSRHDALKWLKAAI